MDMDSRDNSKMLPFTTYILNQNQMFNSSRCTSSKITRRFNITNTSASPAIHHCSKPALPRDLPDTDSNGFIRRFLHKRSSVGDTAQSLFLGDKLRDTLRGINLSGDRLRLDGLIPPPPPPAAAEVVAEPDPLEGISVEEAKKLLRFSQLEVLKAKLKRNPKSCVSYSEYLEICGESSNNQGLGFAKMLDESGSVIVLGDIVFLRPEQVTMAIEALIPASVTNPNDPRRKEFDEMVKQKAVIDKEADMLVRRELWAGLGFMMVQTAGFMRLTFWELSWDIMEPICFYVTSMYFMAGYTFFLKTSREPSFEGFFASRFDVKQKQMMTKKKFDIKRFDELRKVFHPDDNEPTVTSASTVAATSQFSYSETRALVGL